VFLGYAPNYKGYCCLDFIKSLVYISKHVLFHECDFPYPTLLSQALQLTPAITFNLRDVFHSHCKCCHISLLSSSLTVPPVTITSSHSQEPPFAEVVWKLLLSQPFPPTPTTHPSNHPTLVPWRFLPSNHKPAIATLSY